ncbi:MAG: hypothetical protein PHY93_04120 [Bacteriovorax sp.]|nr:hypothetical protein [Bacteriovorax sp.]
MRVLLVRLLLVLYFLSLNSVSALDIDEKLTLRFLKVSNSKKTVLINRGAEDGVVVGNHAKFFITSGVIARGVAEKVSPSRSIWSLYRVVDPAEITDGKVLNLKIASPVKITDDPSKSMKDEPIPAGTDKMDMGDAAAEATTTSKINEDEQKELEGMGLEESGRPAKKETPAKSTKGKESKEVSIMEETPVHGGTNKSKNWEVWGLLNLDSISGTQTNTTSTTSVSKDLTSSKFDFTLGLERYFLNSDSFLKDVSIFAFLNKAVESSGLDITKDTIDWLRFGGGAFYHFYNSAASTNKIICFGEFRFGGGTGTLTSSSGTSPDISAKGSSTLILGGLGLKYVLINGLGMRASLQYYNASESLSYPDDQTVKNTYSGPRIEYGISYRF